MQKQMLKEHEDLKLKGTTRYKPFHDMSRVWSTLLRTSGAKNMEAAALDFTQLLWPTADKWIAFAKSSGQDILDVTLMLKKSWLDEVLTIKLQLLEQPPVSSESCVSPAKADTEPPPQALSEATISQSSSSSVAPEGGRQTVYPDD